MAFFDLSLLLFELRFTLRTRGRVLLQLAVGTPPGLSYMSRHRKRGPKQRYKGQYRNAEEDTHESS